jgi:hypothetical protein
MWRKASWILCAIISVVWLEEYDASIESSICPHTEKKSTKRNNQGGRDERHNRN